MKPLLAAAIDAYLQRDIAAPSPAFRDMEAEGRRKGLPLIDRQVGRLLELLVQVIGARRILEIGTAIGYSTAWMASAAGPGAKITSIEIDPGRAERAERNLAKARLARRVTVVVGDACDVVSALEGPFDLIFNDGAKGHYPLVAEHADRLLRSGGILASDNALWSGTVATPGGDADTRAIRRHNRFLMRSAGFTSIILPIRDGVLLARRK